MQGYSAIGILLRSPRAVLISGRVVPMSGSRCADAELLPPGILRAATAWQVSRSLAFGSENCGPLEEELHASLPNVPRIDIFVSHSWECPWWMKVLALCQYLNLDRAISMAVLTWCCTVMLVMHLHSDETWTVEHQAYALVFWPMAVFFAVYFLSHGLHTETFWIDRICVNQADPEMKARALDALLPIISQSREMLVMLNDQYLDRLWCNFEIASFQSSGDRKFLDIMPLWLPIWMLSCMAMDLLGLALVLLSFASDSDAALTDDIKSRTDLFLVMFAQWCGPSIIYSSTALLSFFVHLRRLRQQSVLLETMAKFDIRQAKCKLESDRQIIEQQILQLEKQHWLTTADESSSLTTSNTTEFSTAAFEDFNRYVRGPMRQRLMDSMGSEVDIPWKLCVVTSLPFLFSSGVGMMSCNGKDCDSFARGFGYATFSQYVLCNLLGSLTVGFLSCPALQPILLRELKWVTSNVQSRIGQLALGALCAFTTYVFIFGNVAAAVALLIVTLTRFSPYWFAGAIVSYTLLLLQNYFLFVKGDANTVATAGNTRRASRREGST